LASHSQNLSDDESSSVLDAARGQGRLEDALREARLVAPRGLADVDDDVDLRFGEDRDELGRRALLVAEGEERLLHFGLFELVAVAARDSRP
jgi:MoaA/NifB/PqqE/SkfB family radical SAM enzyme